MIVDRTALRKMLDRFIDVYHMDYDAALELMSSMTLIDKDDIKKELSNESNT